MVYVWRWAVHRLCNSTRLYSLCRLSCFNCDCGFLHTPTLRWSWDTDIYIFTDFTLRLCLPTQIPSWKCQRQPWRQNPHDSKQWDRWGKGRHGKFDKPKDGRLTLRGDLACANEVALVPDEDDGGLGLRLPEEEPELSGAVEATPVGHWKHQDTHLTQQSRQVLRDTHRPYSGLYLNMYSGRGAGTDSDKWLS